jgi:hypothetical protein
MSRSLPVALLALPMLVLMSNQHSFAQKASSSEQSAPSATAAQSPAAAATAPEASAPHGHGIGEVTILTVRGKIAAVNKARNLVTLVGPEGNRVTLKVANSESLASVKAGDTFVAHFIESVHVRRKRPSEVLPAVSIKEGISRATPDQAPGGVIHTKRKVVLTVAGIDPKDRTLTVKDPGGAEETVKVDDPRYLGHLKVGDDLVVTVRQAIAISLDKE